MAPEPAVAFSARIVSRHRRLNRRVKGQGASFRRAILDRARLDEADLRGADLREACLYGAVLRRADLRGVDATGADTTDVVADAKAVKQAAAWPAEGAGRNCGR